MKPSQVESTLHLGKGGATEAWIQELREQARRRKLVKVRLLRNSKEGKTPKDIAEVLARRSGLDLVDVRGSTAVFGDPKRRPDPSPAAARRPRPPVAPKGR